MKTHSIELTLKLDHEKYVWNLLLEFFGRKTSSFLPIYIMFKNRISGLDDPSGEEYIWDWRICEGQNDPDEPARELGIIDISSYPSIVLVIFEGSEGISEKEWGKVEKMVDAIISRVQKLQIEIISINPKRHLPKNLLPPWKRIEDKYSNREILELWYRGKSCPEIAESVPLSHRAVTNMICSLRKEYGHEVVPYDKERRENYKKLMTPRDMT